MKNDKAFKAICKKHGLSVEEGMNLMSGYFNNGSEVVERLIKRAKNTGEFKHQDFTNKGGTFSGTVTEDTSEDKLSAQQKRLPYLSPNYFDPEGVWDYNIEGYQQAYNDYANRVKQAVDNNPYLTDEQKKEYKASIDKETFVDEQGKVRSFDGIYGNFTSSRPSFGLPILSEEEYKKYGDKFVGDFLDENGEVKKEFSDLSPKTVEYLKELASDPSNLGRNISASYYEPQEQDTSQEDETGLEPDPIKNPEYEFIYPDVPRQFINPPTPLGTQLLTSVEFDRVNPVYESYDPVIQNRNESLAFMGRRFDVLPDSQSKAYAAQVISNITETPTNNYLTSLEATIRKEGELTK